MGFKNQLASSNFHAGLVAKVCCLLLLASLGVTAYAQGSPQGKVKHVIIMIQENRTPDNLFYLDSNLVTNGANVHPAPADVKCDNSQVSLAGINLDVCFDTKHLHQDWTSMYNGGDMRGACRVRVNRDACQPDPACVAAHTCPYSYVTNSADGTWAYSLIHQFDGSDGAYPNANLIFDDQGNLYGTTILGGPGGAGVVFKLTP